MDFVQACFLFIAAWISGVLNSVAGGGGLIIFPSLIFTGLPAINAMPRVHLPHHQDI